MNTRGKRAAAVAAGRPFLVILSEPDSTIALDDRQLLGYAYNGTLATLLHVSGQVTLSFETVHDAVLSAELVHTVSLDVLMVHDVTLEATLE